MKLQRIPLEGFTIGFSEAAKDSELIEEVQHLLRNAGCTIGEIDGQWNVNTAAAMAVFCAVHSITAHGLTPKLASELLEYREELSHG